MTDAPNEALSGDDIQALEGLKSAFARVKEQLGRVIIGQEEVVDHLLIAIFAQGHCILEGVPGLAKTLMVDSLSKTLEMTFRRIQFTPDLMPSDITGTEVIQDDKVSGERHFKFMPGPIFTNILLADEINRTPPKTQAALLEAMQEKQVSIGGQRHELPKPFFVLATQNPIEQEGTYPLPEAQQDRFMFKILVRYPSFEEEFTIAERTTAALQTAVDTCFDGDAIRDFQALIRRVPVPPEVIRYALHLVRATRVMEDDVPDFVKQWVSWGAGPRAVQFLLLGAKARAALEGRHFASVDDVRSVAHPVLRHRIITNFHAESEGMYPDRVIDELVKLVDGMDLGEASGSAVAKAFGS